MLVNKFFYALRARSRNIGRLRHERCLRRVTTSYINVRSVAFSFFLRGQADRHTNTRTRTRTRKENNTLLRSA